MNSMFGATGFSPQTTNTGSQKTPNMMKGKWAGDKLPKGYRVGQLAQFDPNQTNLYESLFGHLGPESYLSRLAGGDQELFEQIERPALQQFSGLQGNLASRFSGMGGLGARRSSGFQNTANQAAQDFASQLQANRQYLQRQALQDLMSSSQMLLGQRPFERFLYEKPEKQGFNWGGLGGAALGGLGGFFVGGPAGALGGAQLGYGLGSSFGGHEGGSLGGGGNLFGNMPSNFDFGDMIANYAPGSVI